MTEETQEDVAVETPVVEAAEEVEEQKPAAKSADYNWQQANSVMAAQKSEIEALKAHMAHLAATANKPQQPVEKDEFEGLDGSEVITLDQARRLAETMATKKAKVAAKEIVEEYMQQHTVQNDEQRMRTQHDDYDYVVENFAVPLIKNDPALAHQIKMSKNPAQTAYRLGKLSDQYEEQMKQQKVSPKAEKIMKNMARPVSGNAIGSPLKAQADDFSKMSQQEIWQMSQKYAKGA